MRKVRYYYWIIQAFTKKHTKILLLAAIIGAISFSQIGTIAGSTPKPKTHQHIGRTGIFTLANLPRNIQVQLSQGLTAIDESGLPIPALALDWKVTDEGKTYVFTLKENLTWQDGTPLTSSDINYNISDVTAEFPDDRTIIFRLEEPFSPFPNIVSQPLFKRAQKSILQVIEQTSIIGTGEFRIIDLQTNGNQIDTITIESASQKKTYRFYSTERAAITAFKLAQIDVIEDITNPSELATWNNVDIQTTPNHQRYAAVFFNTRDRNLGEKSLRQALTYLIPSKPRGSERAFGPISPNSWAYNPQVKPYEFSQENAQSLLENNNTDFELELTTTPTYERLAESIKSTWGQVGINVKVKVVNVPDTTDFQALLIGQQIPQDPDQYLLWHSTQDANITGYQSPKVDKLLEDGRKEFDIQKRKVIYQDFQRFLVEDTPAAFLFHLQTHTIKRS